MTGADCLAVLLAVALVVWVGQLVWLVWVWWREGRDG